MRISDWSSDVCSSDLLGKTESDRYIVISAHDHTTSEVRVIEADAPEGAPRLIAARERGIEYDVSDHNGRFLILTNADGAIDYKIIAAPLDAPGRANWRDLVTPRPGCPLLGPTLFKIGSASCRERGCH